MLKEKSFLHVKMMLDLDFWDEIISMPTILFALSKREKISKRNESSLNDDVIDDYTSISIFEWLVNFRNPFAEQNKKFFSSSFRRVHNSYKASSLFLYTLCLSFVLVISFIHSDYDIDAGSFSIQFSHLTVISYTEAFVVSNFID